jgi:hypothetical protein
MRSAAFCPQVTTVAAQAWPPLALSVMREGSGCEKRLMESVSFVEIACDAGSGFVEGA